MPFGLIGGLFGGMANLGVGMMNMTQQQNTNLMNMQLMRESWARDDNAVQRRVADLKAAGLSPVLAAGQGASNSGPVRMESPELKYDALQGVLAASQIAHTIAQNKVLEQQAEDLKWYNKFQAETHPIRVREATAKSMWETESLDNRLEELRLNLRDANATINLKEQAHRLEAERHKIDLRVKEQGIQKVHLDMVHQIMAEQGIAQKLRANEIDILSKEIALEIARHDKDIITNTISPSGHFSGGSTAFRFGLSVASAITRIMQQREAEKGVVRERVRGLGGGHSW